MESNRKHQGFIKAKPTPFYRTAKVKPNQASSTTATFSYRVHQDYKISQTKQVSFFLPADKNRESITQIGTFFGVAGDETVDIKAATYISSVQERFKLERNNSESFKKLARKRYWMNFDN